MKIQEAQKAFNDTVQRIWQTRVPVHISREKVKKLQKLLIPERKHHTKITKESLKYGARVRERREETGLTQAELAEELGVSRSLISQIETGRHMPEQPRKFLLSI